jgi:superfamily I DNA and/or RNA helicase
VRKFVAQGAGPQWVRAATDPAAPLVWVATAALSERGEVRAASGRGFTNPTEATVAAALCGALLLAGLPPAELGVTSPYSRQIERLRDALRGAVPVATPAAVTADDVDVMTVQFQGQDPVATPAAAAAAADGMDVMTIDKFQGQDRAALVLSLVRSAPGRGVAIAGLLTDFRRVNVALTRAKHKLIIIGDSATLSDVPMLSAAFKAVKAYGRVVALQDGAILMTPNRD